jgi:hypothetical protein
MRRKCSNCGSQEFITGKLIGASIIIRETETRTKIMTAGISKERELTACICKKCNLVDFFAIEK